MLVIYNNISMGRPTASRDEVMGASKKARCYDFITVRENSKGWYRHRN